MAIVCLCGGLCMDNGHNMDDDFALYLEQSQAILDGNVSVLYEKNRLAMEYSGATTGPYLYPMGFPLLLAPVVYWFGIEWLVLKWFCFLFFVASLPFVWSVLRYFESNKKYCYLTLVSIALNYHFIRFGDWIYSDLPFFFFFFISLHQILHLKKTTTYSQYLLLGISIWMTYWIRDIGITLFVFLFAYQWQHRLISTIKNHFPYTFCLAAWLLVQYFLPDGGANHRQLLLSNISWQSIGNNILLYSKLVGNFWFIFRPIPIALQYFISGILILLLYRGYRQKSTLTRSYLIYLLSSAFLVICLSWVSFQGMRFVFPLLPFLTLGIIRGIDSITFLNRLRTNYVLLTLILLQTTLTTFHYYNKNTNEVATAEMLHLYQFIKHELPPDALIQSNKPRTLRLFTNRNSCQKKHPQLTHQLIQNPQQAIPNSAKIIFQNAHYTLIDL
jgi:hypothetical protein